MKGRIRGGDATKGERRWYAWRPVRALVCGYDPRIMKAWRDMDRAKNDFRWVWFEELYVYQEYSGSTAFYFLSPPKKNSPTAAKHDPIEDPRGYLKVVEDAQETA